MATLEKALQLAVAAHMGQQDKAGEPYILHPLRLMLRLQSEEARIVAVLHDLLEDTSITLEQLRREGFSERVLIALDHLTHRAEASYEAYIQRLQKNPLAVQIKCLDLEDNMDIRRLASPLGDRDCQRLKKYRHTWSVLRGLPEPVSPP